MNDGQAQTSAMRVAEVADGARTSLIDLEAEADLSRCGAIRDYWYVACLAGELTPARPLRRVLFGLPIVLFRSSDGSPAALLDRCLHRNAQLSQGDVFNGRIGCPYHGWTYAADGRCVHIPSLGPKQCGSVLDSEGHARAGLSLGPEQVGAVRSFATCELDGLVYLYMGDDPARARRDPFRVPHWGEPSWRVYFMVTRFQNGVTNLVENFMDVPHTVFVHRGWFRRAAQRQVPAMVERTAETVLVTYEQERDELTGFGRIMNPRGEAMLHTDKFYAPNVTRVDYLWGDRSGFVINSQCTPIGPTETLVYTAISFRMPWDLPGNLLARAFTPLLAWYTRQVIRQDVDIMQIQRDGLLAAPGGGNFASTEADLLHADIEDCRGWLRGGARGAGPSDEARRIAFWI